MLEQKIIVINTSQLIALVAAWGTRLSRCLAYMLRYMFRLRWQKKFAGVVTRQFSPIAKH